MNSYAVSSVQHPLSILYCLLYLPNEANHFYQACPDDATGIFYLGRMVCNNGYIYVGVFACQWGSDRGRV